LGQNLAHSPHPTQAVIGKHDLCHKEFPDQEINDGEKRNQPQDADAPQCFPKVVARKIDTVPFHDAGHQLRQLLLCLIRDCRYIFRMQSPMKIDEIGWHVQAEERPGPISFNNEFQIEEQIFL